MYSRVTTFCILSKEVPFFSSAWLFIGKILHDIRVDILENEIREVDKKYNNYKNSIITNNNVNNCLSTIFDDKKIEAIKKYNNIIDNDLDNNLELMDYKNY